MPPIRTERPFALLVQPPIYDFALYDLFLKPYGLLRIGRWLSEGGWEVSFVNGLDYSDPATLAALGRAKRKPNGTGKFHRILRDYPPGVASCGRRFSRYGMIEESFRRKIEEASSVRGTGPAAKPPDIVLVSTGMTYWYHGAVEATRVSREAHPGTPVVAGGIYATLMPEHCRRAVGPDYVVEGEAWSGLAAVFGRLGLPIPVNAPPSRPLPLRDVWTDAGVLRLNRGCPLSCDYCASATLSGGFAAGDPEGSFEAFRELAETCGTRNFALYDDALLFRKETVFLPFLRKIVEWTRAEERRGRNRPAPSFFLPNAVHIRYIDEESARLMRAAGVREVRMGFESSSGEFHERHDGKFEAGTFRDALEALRNAGYQPEEISVYVLAGLPGQRAEEVEESVRYVLSRGVRARIAEYSPVPGTALWEESVRACRYPLEEEPLYHNNSFFPLEWEGFSREDLEALKALSRNGAAPPFRP